MSWLDDFAQARTAWENAEQDYRTHAAEAAGALVDQVTAQQEQTVAADD